jgi:hypothetical protein
MPQRTDLIASTISAIAADSTIAGSRVYRGRHNVLAGADFPAAYVWMSREDIDQNGLTRNRNQLRTMQLVVDYWNRADSAETLEEGFDAACVSIERAASGTTAGIANAAAEDIILTSAEYLYDGEEAQYHGCARVNFLVRYLSKEP